MLFFSRAITTLGPLTAGCAGLITTSRKSPLYSFRRSLLVVALFLAPAHAAAAHDIPSDVTVHAFVRPAGERLQLLVRVPLKAIRDLDFPERERGYLDVEKLAPRLPDAATLWISD